jgi:HPt (histidine-containing phosphotransfer) domain-containing protein
MRPSQAGSDPNERAPLLPRVLALVAAATVIAFLTWLWAMTRTVVPEDHARMDSTFRELRSLDRIVNQDVLKARLEITRGYDLVRRSYRRIEQLESIVAVPPSYLDPGSRRLLANALADYRAAVTTKQRLTEYFKYRVLVLDELLAYLPGAGTGVAQTARASGDESLAKDVSHILQLVLLYTLTSNKDYPPVIRRDLESIEVRGRNSSSYLVRRRVRTLVLNIRELLEVKPDVDGALVLILAQPIPVHEERVAATYDAGYSAADLIARRYRFALYGICLALFGAVGYAFVRLRRTAGELEASAWNLERRVAERTHELGERNVALRSVLDNVGQALVAVDLDGKMGSERSSTLDQWFPGAKPGLHVSAVLGAGDPEQTAWVDLGWEQIQDGILPIEIALAQLPATLALGGRCYDVGYRTVGGASAVEKILILITDVTEARERERSETEQREHLAMFQQMVKDRAELTAYLAECERLAAVVLANPPTDRETLLRALHTLKGNMAIRGIESVAKACHALEAELRQPSEKLSPPDWAGFADTWAVFAARIHDLTRAVPDDRIELTRPELHSVRDAAAAGASPERLAAMLSALELEPAAHRLEHLAEDARRLADRLGKGGLTVTIEADDLRFDRRRWAPFWAAFVHMLRNAIDHGIEPPDERLAQGKSRAGCVALRAQQGRDGVIVIEIADDGRGIDWQAIRTRVQALGRSATTESELQTELLEGGFSTRTVATETSGRGAGVAACRHVCASLGGNITVETVPRRGTTFRFTFPFAAAAMARMTAPPDPEGRPAGAGTLPRTWT